MTAPASGRAAAATAEAHAWIRENQADLIELASDLIRFDTRGVHGSDRTSNDEGACQVYIADYLGSRGCEIDRIEPDPALFACHPMMPEGLDWRGRALTVARRAGGNGSATLAFNGHIDVVDVEPRVMWSDDPFTPTVRDGRLFGRGAADMKGGLAAAMFALAALDASGIELGADVWLQATSDEETTGMGTVALAELAPIPSVAVFAEPTDFDFLTACRGVLLGEIEIEGRAAHAELPQPSWREGGGVNAIEKLAPVLQAIDEINRSWAAQTHPLLSPPALIPTVVRGGDFAATLAGRATLTIDVTYLPARADADGFGSVVRAEIENRIQGHVGGDDWLAQNPLVFRWHADYPPYDPGALDPAVVGALEETAAEFGLRPRMTVTDSWHDAATLGRVGKIPSFSFGPGDSALAHSVDESIPVADIVVAAQLFCGFAIRHCGRA